MRFTDKVCLVTGGNSGIGRATSLRLAAEGGKVAILSRTAESGNAVVAEITQAGGTAIFLKTDVGNPADLEAAVAAVVAAVVAQWQRIDVVVNNAAMMTYKPITELSIEEWDQVMNVNVRAVFLLSKFCLPHMKKGAMVNVSSVHAHDTTPNVTPYAASKGALEAFMFATGIENSYPTIQLPDGSRKRIDSMEKSGQYRRWREDFDLVKGLALDFLRYGPPYYRVHRGPGQYDWDRNIRPVGTAYRQLVADCKALLGGKSYGIHLNA